MSSVVLLTIYCALILLASLAGGWIPLFLRLTHTKMQVATSFVAGLMLGVGVLHLLPHAWDRLRSIDRAASWLLAGFLVMFFIQRFFHFHHHDVSAENSEGDRPDPEEHAHFHGEEEHGHDHEATLSLADRSALKLTWTGAALGLTLHTLIDGVALAASVKADGVGEQPSWLLGFGTFLVIILHKPFDAMAIGTLMAAGGSSRLSRHLVNGLFGLAIPTGVILFHLGATQFSGDAGRFLGSALAFAAGTFLCIASSDLLPELQFHSHDRIKLSMALVSGLALAMLIGTFETTGHEHHAAPAPEEGALEKPAGRAHDHGR
ncbi:MAG: ZIP family metal transporter [Verrucomicrobia bacterium]|nr:ZIP family metal transporter [Verrucomicrobiota bacterium]